MYFSKALNEHTTVVVATISLKICDTHSFKVINIISVKITAVS